MMQLGAQELEQAKVEFWFRKAPASFYQLTAWPDPEAFWIRPLAVPCFELSTSYPDLLGLAFHLGSNQEWTGERYRLRVGHSDLVVLNGPIRCLYALLVNQETTPVPWAYRERCVHLTSRLKMIPLGIMPKNCS